MRCYLMLQDSLALCAFAMPGILMVAAGGISDDAYSRRSAIGRRAAQTEAVCLEEFGWMNNSLQQTPCLVAAYLLSPCNANGGDVRATNYSYLPPTAEGAQECWCSWAVYNTLEACALCQGPSDIAEPWNYYRTNCSADLLSDSLYYPSDTPIAEETAIPFWATTDPSTWHDALFNVTEAENFANENKDDITQASRKGSTTNSSSSTNSTGSTSVTMPISTAQSDSNPTGSAKSKVNAGAIVGGIIGGLLFLLGSAFLAFFLVRRKRARQQHLYHQIEPNTTITPLITADLGGVYRDVEERKESTRRRSSAKEVPRINIVSNQVIPVDLADEGMGYDRTRDSTTNGNLVGQSNVDFAGATAVGSVEHDRPPPYTSGSLPDNA